MTASEQFTPKLVTVLKEGYSHRAFQSDVMAGLTVAILALPLSMAIAIASGASPERGLYAAIIGGCLISLLGGSRYQIGGPAGAFIVLVASIIHRHGFEGFVLATLMAGGMMILAGLFRLGSYIRFIPHPVIVGFSAAIGVIIFFSQIRDLLGLSPPVAEPVDVLHKLAYLWQYGLDFSLPAAGLSALTLALLIGLKRWRPRWPGMLIALTLSTLLALILHLDVTTIGSKFGAIPSSLPAPALPAVSVHTMRDLFPEALAIAVLGSIESLLSAVIADGMTGTRHRSNCELVAQGIANIGTALFGGICVTGTIARTATNIRAGAHGPVSGILHALFLLGFMMLCAPLMAHIPLAALAAVLALVAWNMIERQEILSLLTARSGDTLVLAASFGLTLFVDLIAGMSVGLVLGSLLFMHRMAQAVSVELHQPMFEEANERTSVAEPTASPDVLTFRLSGPLFFGATSTLSQTLDRIGQTPRLIILDFANVPFIDTSGLHALERFVQGQQRRGTGVIFSAATVHLRRDLVHGGLRPPHVTYAPSIADAMMSARNLQ